MEANTEEKAVANPGDIFGFTIDENGKAKYVKVAHVSCFGALMHENKNSDAEDARLRNLGDLNIHND